MPSIAKRWLFCFAAAIFILYNFQSWHTSFSQPYTSNRPTAPVSTTKWREVSNSRFPLDVFVSPPKGPPKKLPSIQAAFSAPEYDEDKKVRTQRLAAVKEAMEYSWNGYRQHAWGKDEVSPISGAFADRFSGWGATLVDSLDTLWIMGMKKEFAEAVAAVSAIDFSTSVQDEVNVFETTIRYLGGFLAAYDLSGEDVLLEKAQELGEMLYVAFDTHNHLPVTRWQWKGGLSGLPQEPRGMAVASEVGSLSLEFTRLAQITGDVRFYDAIDRISHLLADQQDDTNIPGLWPTWLDTGSGNFSRGGEFTVGALTDSMFEYLPKMHALLGGNEPMYQRMYEKAMLAMEKHIFFRALNPDNLDILFPGDVRAHQKNDPNAYKIYNVQHLGCYVGGMVGIGGKLFENPANLAVARKLTDGCIWAYEAAPNGIMPEIFTALPCDKETNPTCEWSEALWLNASMARGSTAGEQEDWLERGRAYVERAHLAPGFVQAHDPRYLLRPEAIESVFILYRMTGDKKLQEHGWNMFQAVKKAAKTDVAYASIENVMIKNGKPLKQEDSMESFWTAETLKYYYLLFSDPEVVSLDDYVLNTEAHPLRRPTSGGRWARKGSKTQPKWGL